MFLHDFFECTKLWNTKIFSKIYGDDNDDDDYDDEDLCLR